MRHDWITALILFLMILLGIVIDELPSLISSLFTSFPEFLAWSDKYIRPIFFFIATYLAIILALKKIGIHVQTQFRIKGDNIYGTYIHEITLINKKDYNLSIFSIDAELPNGPTIKLVQFSPPVILKALEAQKYEIEPFSIYDPIFKDLAKAKINISTESHYYTCKTANPKYKEGTLTPFRQKKNGVLIGAFTEYVVYLKEEKDSPLKIVQVNKAGVFSESIKGYSCLKHKLPEKELFFFFKDLNLHYFKLYDEFGMCEIYYESPLLNEEKSH